MNPRDNSPFNGPNKLFVKQTSVRQKLIRWKENLIKEDNLKNQEDRKK